MRSPAPRPASRFHPLIVALVLIIALSNLPLLSSADDATPEALAPVPEPTVVVPPTMEPLPTQNPPTVLPTQIPPPADLPVPLETFPPTVETTPEPPPTPTPTPEVVESVETTEGNSPTSSAPETGDLQQSTPEPPATPGDELPTPEPIVTAQPNTDTVTLLAPIDAIVLAPGGTTTLNVSYAVTTERDSTSAHLELRGADGRLADGWSLALLPGGIPDGPAVEMTDATALMPSSSVTLELLAQAPADVDEAQSVTLHIRSVESSGSLTREALTGDAPIATMTVLPPTPVAEADSGEAAATPTASDLSLACSADGTASLTGDDPVTVSCAFRGNDSLGDRDVTLSQVSVSAPDGWMVTASEVPGEESITTEPRRTLGAGEDFTFAFAASPAVCNADPGSLSVRSTLLPGEGSDGEIDGPETSLAIEVLPPPALPPGVDISALSFGASERTDDGYATVTGSMAITVSGNTASACAATTTEWSVQVGTAGLTAAGRGDSSIPAESITYLGSQSTEGAPSGILPLATDVSLATGQMTTIAHGGELGMGGTWNAMFQLDPSSDLPSGIYEGEISVTIINGP